MDGLETLILTMSWEGDPVNSGVGISGIKKLVFIAWLTNVKTLNGSS